MFKDGASGDAKVPMAEFTAATPKGKADDSQGAED